MAPDLFFNTGIVICVATVAGAVIAAIALRFYKTRLDQQLDAAYGKRRH